jgi:signal peptidase I
MTAERPPRRRRRPWRVVYWVTLSLYIPLSVGLLAWLHVSSGAIRVVSGEMAPTIPAGSTVMYERGASGVVPGDIVVDQTPNGLLILRVIGLPGDRVTCCDQADRIAVNGRTLEESYLGPDAGPTQPAFAVTLGPGQMWLMADERGDSVDSRSWGPVPVSGIVGRVVQMSAPGGGLSQVQTPETFVANGLAPADQGDSHVYLLLVLIGFALMAMVVQALVGILLWALRRRRRRRQPRPGYA